MTKRYKALERVDCFNKVDVFCFDDENFYTIKNGVYSPSKLPQRHIMTNKVKPLITVEEPELFIKALMSVGIKEEAQGFNEGKLKAVEDHLADLKKLLFHTMKVKNGRFK